jgi:hypothetical protein
VRLAAHQGAPRTVKAMLLVPVKDNAGLDFPLET